MSVQLTEKQQAEGWRVVKFGDICQEVKATSKNALTEGLEHYIGLEHLDSGSLRIKRRGSIAEDNPSFTKKFSPGHLLFGKRRCYLKKAAVADFEGICSGDIIIMAAKGDQIVPELLPFIVQSDAFWKWAEQTSSGSLSPRTKFKSLAEWEFPLPPVERQKELLKLCNSSKYVLESTDMMLEEFTPLLDQFLNKLTKCDFAVSRLSAAKYNSNFPNNWGICRINDIALKERNSFVIGPFGSNLVRSDYQQEGTPVVFVRDIKKNLFNWISNVFISEKKLQSLKAHNVKPGDIVITKMGLPPGISAIYPDTMPEGVITADIIRLRIDPEKVNPIYLCAVLNSTFFMRQVSMITAGQTRPKLTLADYKSLWLPIAPLDTQKQIAAAIVKTTKTKNEIKNKLSATSNLYQSILNACTRGR